MPRTRIHVTLPEGIWVHDVSTSHPDAVFRVLAATAGESAGTGLVELRATDPGSVVTGVADHDGVDDVAILDAHEDGAFLQFETSQPLLLQLVDDSRVPLEFPVDVTDGVATVELTATHDRISALADQLRSFGLAFDVEFLHDELESPQLLTTRQRELLEAAVSVGYYDTPRTCTLTELADREGMAKSTVSETLHRAEGTVVKEFLDRLSPGSP
jgi:hypothetical protein